MLLKQKILDKQSFILYEYLLAIADWDQTNHPATYGTVKKTNDEIARGLGWAPCTISRARQELLEKGFIINHNKKQLYIPLLWITEQKNAIYLKTGKHAKLQEKYSNLQDAISFLKGDFAFLQAMPTKKQISPITKSDISCKYKSEYIKDDNKVFSADDEKWCDAHIIGFENKFIEIQQNESSKNLNFPLEKDVVEIFFNGDWKKYRQNLITT